jgi:hypothetical protein
MRHRDPIGGLPVAIAIALAVVLTACVPEPTNRPSQAAGATARSTPTPFRTPAGPTPMPSFVRPTPTPQPTFLVYTVVAGDSLVAIGRKFNTSGRSIAYWNRATYPSLDPDSAGYDPNYLKLGWMLVLIPNKEVDPENLPPGRETPSPSPAEPEVTDAP